MVTPSVLASQARSKNRSREQSQTSQKKQMVFESIVDLIGGWYQGVYHRSMVERPKTWARVMREMEWHAAAAEQEDASQEST
jgi:hypothetical protein